ncbi:MAG: hypothetical protein QW728_05890, partial [Thermoplasmata archaeon]
MPAGEEAPGAFPHTGKKKEEVSKSEDKLPPPPPPPPPPELLREDNRPVSVEPPVLQTTAPPEEGMKGAVGHGLTNGKGIVNTEGGKRDRLRKKKQRTDRALLAKRRRKRNLHRVAVGVCVLLMLILIPATVFILYWGKPAMAIDGRLDDWQHFNPVRDGRGGPNEPLYEGVNIIETAAMENSNTLYLYIKTAGDILKPQGTDTVDAVYIFIDKDSMEAISNNGFLIHNIYADFRISISGW